MNSIKPITYVVSLIQNTPTNINNNGLTVESPAFAIQNNSTEDIFIGGIDAQLFRVRPQDEFEWSGVDGGNRMSDSVTSSGDIFVLCGSSDASIVVLAAVKS